MAYPRPTPPPGNPRAFTKISKCDNKTDQSPLALPTIINNRPSPMPCNKADARLREDPAAGGDRVNPIAARLRRRYSIPNAGHELGLEAKEERSMVERRQCEGGRRSRRQGSQLTRMSWSSKGRQRTRRNTKNIDYVATAGVVPRPLVKQKPTVSLQFNARRVLLDCEAFNASLSYVKQLCANLP